MNQNKEHVILDEVTDEIIIKNNDGKYQKYCKEVPILLYRKNMFPRECLGPGSLCITPQMKDDIRMKIWIWIHPAIFQEIYRELKKVNKTHLTDLKSKMNVEIKINSDFSIRNNNDLISLSNNINVDDISENSTGNNVYEDFQNFHSNDNENNHNSNNDNNCSNNSNNIENIENIDDENAMNNHDYSDEMCQISCIPKGIQRFCIRGLGSKALLEKVLKINENNKYMDDETKTENENENGIRSKSYDNNTNNNEGTHLNNHLSRRYEDKKTKNKNISENEVFFTKILSHQLMSRIWPENGILGILIEDVRKLTKLHESEKLVFEENSSAAKRKSFTVDLKQNSKQIIRNDDNNSNKNKNNYESKNDNDTGKKKNNNNNNNNNNSNNNNDNNNNNNNNNNDNFDSKTNEVKNLRWPLSASSSPLWNDKGRQKHSDSFISDHFLNDELYKQRQDSYKILNNRESNIIFTNNNLENKNSGPNFQDLPILIIRKDLKNYSSKRMKNKKNKYFIGFDIIIPSNWGQAMWKAFQFAGGKAIGIDEMDCIHNDCGLASFPR